jgi:hypothetical protein
VMELVPDYIPSKCKSQNLSASLAAETRGERDPYGVFTSR